MKLRLARTELWTQDHTGIRAGAAWLGSSGSPHSLPLPCVTGSQLLPDLHFWCCMDFNSVFLIGIEYFWLWKYILLTSGSHIESVSACLNSSLRCDCFTWTQKQGPGKEELNQTPKCPEWTCQGKGPAAPSPQPTTSPLGPADFSREGRKLYTLWNLPSFNHW